MKQIHTEIKFHAVQMSLKIYYEIFNLFFERYFQKKYKIIKFQDK